MRRILAVLIVPAMLLVGAARASAYATSASDPQDNTQGALDIRTLYNDDSSTAETFGIDFYKAWDVRNTPGYHLTWFLDLNLDGNYNDACIVMQQDSVDPSRGRAVQYYGGACGDNGLPSGTASAKGTPQDASNPSGTLYQFSVDLQQLRDTGLKGNDFKYRVKAYECSTTAETSTTAPGSSSTVPPTCTSGTSSVPSDTAPDNQVNDNSQHVILGPAPGAGGGTNNSGGSNNGGSNGGGTSGGTSNVNTTTTLPGNATQSAASVNKSTVDAGDTVTMSGNGFAPNSVLTITLLSNPVILGTVSSDSFGQFTATVRIPADTLPGTHTLDVSGPDPTGHRHDAVATITVTLPRTGIASATRTTATGIAVIALGFALVALAYYERHRVSIGATRATAAITTALKRFEL